jgi:hypothetical protein
VLEKKLDGIVQLLQRSHGQSVTPNQSVDSHPSKTPNHEINHVDETSTRNPTAANGSSYGSAYSFAGSSSINRSPYSTPASLTNSANHAEYPLETDEELQECLDTYRSKMTHYFPVVVLSSSITVLEMQETRPFLWLVIRAISSTSPLRQRHLGQELKRALGQEMLVEGTKSLDLLLGILVFCGWGYYYRKPVITPVIQLGMSLAYDLGLTKLNSEPHRTILNLSSQGCPKPSNGPINAEKTMEERRAVVGLFLVSST